MLDPLTTPAFLAVCGVAFLCAILVLKFAKPTLRERIASNVILVITFTVLVSGACQTLLIGDTFSVSFSAGVVYAMALCLAVMVLTESDLARRTRQLLTCVVLVSFAVVLSATFWSNTLTDAGVLGAALWPIALAALLYSVYCILSAFVVLCSGRQPQVQHRSLSEQYPDLVDTSRSGALAA